MAEEAKTGGKKTGLIIAGVIVAILAMWGIGTYNGFVGKKAEVDEGSSNIDVQLKRRADLIPNLVNTIKGYTSHEQEVIDSITNARENMLKANTMSEKAEADAQLSSALSGLAIVVENYPDLKADKTFVNLQDELAGTENRISKARSDYNEDAKDYNVAIKRFPGSLIAGIGGFSEVEYFEASESDKENPTVDFSK
ncbi:MAG: LemA family protein [Candidatus Saccharibacteria bacterium]|nr:LemA family protein [Candidatus Saccharibacteria bacterium]